MIEQAGAAAAPASAASPLDEEGLRARVHKCVEDLLAAQVGAFDAIAPELGAVLEALTDLLAGGKRLRPAFCYWGWRGAGGADTEGIVAAASALELLQACALVHDDVMDGSDTRRGLPSAHRRFAALHRGNGWHGSPERFGEGAAILLGDLCLSWTDEGFFRSGLPAEDLLRAKPVLDAMRTELMAGQYLDLVEQVRGDGGDRDGRGPRAEDGGELGRVMRVVRYKAAKYTVERPLHLGATLAGAPPALLAGYSAFGLPLGEAFQLRDDLLGTFGDPAETGKPAGDDLREGKRTALVALAAQQATPAQAAVVRRLLGDPGLDADGVAALREVLIDTGARDRVEALIDTLTAQALDALAAAGVAPPAGDVLARLALAATARSG